MTEENNDVPSYGMYTPAGNVAVHELVTSVRAFARETCKTCGRPPTESELRADVHNRMEILAKTHSEVFDTEARACLYYALRPLWEELGYDDAMLSNEL